MHDNTVTPHAFRDTLSERVETYLTHAAAWNAADAADDAAERKRAGDRRRRALASLARYAADVRATLGDDGAALSGGYRRALDDARAALDAYPTARAALDALPVEDVRTWTPGGVARCPRCETVGGVAEDFGARLDRLAVPLVDLVTTRAAWAADDTLTDGQRARIANDAPTPHPTRTGYASALGPYRQSNCYACRAVAARAARTPRNHKEV